MSRLALSALTHTFMVFQTIAMSHGSQCIPPVTDYAYTLQANSYTGPTRHAVCNALPGLAACFHVQASAPGDDDSDPWPFVPGCCGSQECESFFGECRSSGTLQNTGAVSCGSLVRHIPKVMMTNKAEADGIITTSKSRHAGTHAKHDLKHYMWRLSDEDITCSIHTGVLMAYDLMRVLGFGQLLKDFTTLGAAMKEYFNIIAPSSPPVRTMSMHPINMAASLASTFTTIHEGVGDVGCPRQAQMASRSNTIKFNTSTHTRSDVIMEAWTTGPAGTGSICKGH